MNSNSSIPVPLIDEVLSFDHQPWQLAARLSECAPILDYRVMGAQSNSFHHRSRTGMVGHIKIMMGESSPFTAVFGEQTNASTINLRWRGAGKVLVEKDIHHLNECSPLVYTPGILYRCVVEDYVGSVIKVSQERLRRTAHAMAGARPLPRLVAAELRRPQFIDNTSARSATLLRSLRCSLELLLHSSGLSSQDLCSLELEEHMLRIFILLLCPSFQLEPGEPPQPEDPAQKCTMDHLLEWIHAHLDQPLSLSELEFRSGYSRRNLQLLFRKHLLCTPTEWVRQQRLERIRKRLLHPEEGDTVSRIAQQYGFANPSAFARLFRERFGLSPSQLLRQRR